jgi:hypothetical protein
MTCLAESEYVDTRQYISGYNHDGDPFYDFAQDPVWVSFCGVKARPGEMEEYLTSEVDCLECLDLCPLTLLGEVP